MRYLPHSLTLCLVLCASLARAGGFVGNGGGLVEANFQYAYFSIGKLIAHCEESAYCKLTRDERALLGRIKEVVRRNSSNSQRLVFIAEKDMPGLFQTGSSEPHRVAVTGLSPDVPIYINVNMLYDQDGRPQIDFHSAIGILVHELGHQAGETDHAALDILGSQIRDIARMNTLQYEFDYGEKPEVVQIMVVNHDFPIKMSDVYLLKNRQQVRNLTRAVSERVACRTPDTRRLGYELNNGHFVHESGAVDRLSFHFSAKIHCKDVNGTTVRVERERFALDLELQE